VNNQRGYSRQPNETPVLITAFNRPKKLENLLHSLEPIAPRKIYFWIDGPRNNSKDHELITKNLEIISKIGWECKTIVKSNEVNLGLNISVRSGINWFFSFEKEGIILEDDLVVNKKFFDFVEYNLEKYRWIENVNCVTGFNMVPTKELENKTSDSRLSIFFESWGWATWKSKWEKIEFDLNFKHKEKLINIDSRYWKIISKLLIKNKIDSWAFRVAINNINKEIYTIVPKYCLTLNEGFDAQATNTKHRNYPIQEPQEIVISDLLNIEMLAIDQNAERWMTENHFRLTFKRYIYFIYKLLF
jgi:hypothetical protein